MKRGSLNILITMIIILVVAIALFVPFKPLWAKIKAQSEDDACKASVSLASSMNIEGRQIISLECPRKNLTFGNEDVRNGVALKEIARRMARCWENMGEDNSEQFERNFLLAGSNPCLICAEIKFERGVRDTKLSGLGQQLKEQEYGGMKIWDYLYEGNFESASSIVTYATSDEGKPVEDMFTDRKYYMMYKVYKHPILGLTKDEAPIIFIVDGDDLERLECSYFYN